MKARKIFKGILLFAAILVLAASLSCAGLITRQQQDIFTHVVVWSDKALEDEKITVQEAAELVQQICVDLGLDCEIEIPQPE